MLETYRTACMLNVVPFVLGKNDLVHSKRCSPSRHDHSFRSPVVAWNTLAVTRFTIGTDCRLWVIYAWLAGCYNRRTTRCRVCTFRVCTKILLKCLVRQMFQREAVPWVPNTLFQRGFRISPNHPTAGVAHFGPNVSNQLNSSLVELVKYYRMVHEKETN